MTDPNEMIARVKDLDSKAQIAPWFTDEEHEMHSADRYVLGIKTHEHVTGALNWPVVAANRDLIAYYRTAAPDLADALSASLQREAGLRKALEQLADCDMHEGNCASIELASKRVRNVASAALALSTPPIKPETQSHDQP